jgi:hypothetical protein
MSRRCFDCGATSDEAAFTGTRKPRRRRDYCTECAPDPGGPGRVARIVARHEALAATREAARAQRPIHTTTLFAWLAGTDSQAPGASAGGEG